MPDHRAPAPRRPGSLTALATGLVLAVVVASGCTAIPSSGGPQGAPAPPAPGDGAGHCCGLLVRGPQPDWGPEQVVRNFLLASAIATNDYSVARKYLTPSAAKSWHPGPSVTILAQEPTVSQSAAARLTGPQGNKTILVRGQEQGRLNSAGQYIAATGTARGATETFALQWSHGQYLIDGVLPANSGKFSELLLTSTLFHLEYTPRNLYYYGLDGNELLPYPVYVPSQGTSSPGALVEDLIHGPGGWLEGSAQTAFPAGTRLVRIEVFPGPSGGRTAVVDLALPGHVPASGLREMAAQLVTTLTNQVYGPPLFRAVKIKINGHSWSPRRSGAPLDLAYYQDEIPQWPAGLTAYYLSQGSVRSLTGSLGHGVVPRAAGAGPVALSQIAVSPNGGHLAALAGPATTLYTGDLAAAGSGERQTLGQLHEQLSGAFTGMSWDSAGNLWVAGQVGRSSGVWVLLHGRGPAVSVQQTGDLTPVTGLRVAPDGVRVALIVGTGADAHLALAAAIPNGAHTGFSLTPAIPIGSSLTSVTALTWYDEDHLLVVTGAGVDSQAWEVPVDGNNPASLAKLQGIATITAAGPKNPFYLGMTSGRLQKAVELNQPLSPITPGQAVIYPG